MRLPLFILTIVMMLTTRSVIAEGYNRPPYPYPYPIPVNGYHLPYPAVQYPARNRPQVAENMAHRPEEALSQEAATTNLLPLNAPTDERETASLAVEQHDAAGEQQTPKNSFPEDMVGNREPSFKLPAEDSGAVATANPSHDASAVDIGNRTETEITLSEQPITTPQSETTVKAKADPVEAVAKPIVIEISLAEKLNRSQPLIETAIRSGNFAEAYYLWRPLAEAGAPSAQYGIGWMYHNGYGLSIDDQKAYEWWGKAAAQNYTEAIFSIGTLYQFGYGSIKKDSRIALSYYLMAAVAGHEESQLILRTMLESGDKKIRPILPALLRYYLYATISGEAESAAILQKMLLKNDPRIKPLLSRLLNHYLTSAINGDKNSRALLRQMILADDSRIAGILPRLFIHYRDSAISGDKESQQVLRTLMLRGDKRAESVVAELLKSHPRILGNIPARVRVKRANTRMGPGTEHKIIKVVKEGDELMVIDRKDGWILAQLSDSDKRVWISAKLIELNP